jgi:hypothetical protein
VLTSERFHDFFQRREFVGVELVRAEDFAFDDYSETPKNST